MKKEKPIEFGMIALEDLSKEAKDMYERSMKKDRSEFVSF